MNTRILNFSKINGTWYYMAGKERPTSRDMMPASTLAILEFASEGADQVILKLLRKYLILKDSMLMTTRHSLKTKVVI